MSIGTGLYDYPLGKGLFPQFRPQRNVPQYAPKKEQGRNEKCKCGSGLKYKNCCGKSEKNAPVLERGQKVSMVLYNGKSEAEATALETYLRENKESKTLLPLPGSLFKLLVEDIIVTETPGKEFADTRYKIEIGGELK